VVHVRNLRLRDSELVRPPAGELRTALSVLNADPGVRYAEPNVAVQAQTNDPFWSLMWGLENTGQTVNGAVGTNDVDIDGPEAWARSTGAGQRVAIVDTGVNFNHADLQGRFATNSGESINGVDDDSSGAVDDVRGWDFIQNDNDPTDANGHGSHVAGIIAAPKENGVGVAGIAPSAQVMSVRALDASGSGSAAGIANAFDYAGDMGFAVVNASLGGGFSQAEQDVIAAHPNTLYVVAAGNGGSDGIGDNNDASPTYPCAFAQANVVCVGATNAQDTRAGFSNFGATTVDLFAPGVNIASVWKDLPGPGNCNSACYFYSDGTSMASPYAAGVVALMRAGNPTLSSAELKAKLLSTADPNAALTGLSVTGGRLNAFGAITSALHTPDTDGDGVADAADNCPGVSNAGQADADGDGAGDACDPDDDNDGAADGSDNCQFVSNPSQANADGDAQGDACDSTPRGPDTDGDGHADMDDNCASAANAGQADADRDGSGDVCDLTPNGVVAQSPVAARAPVLSALRLGRGKLSRSHPLIVRFSLDRAATTRLTLSRMVGRRYRKVKTVSVKGAAGGNRYVLRSRLGRTKLRRGRYRLSVRASDGTLTSKRLAAALRVR
jgi:subtilisin family serine protease